MRLHGFPYYKTSEVRSCGESVALRAGAFRTSGNLVDGIAVRDVDVAVMVVMGGRAAAAGRHPVSMAPCLPAIISCI